MKKLKFVIEKHRDGYVAYPLGLKGAVVGEGDSYESALADAHPRPLFILKALEKKLSTIKMMWWSLYHRGAQRELRDTMERPG